MAKAYLSINGRIDTIVTGFNDLVDIIGDKAALNTTEDSDIVGAINSLYALIDSDLDFRSKISVTDAGGDGSLSYNSATGVITYIGPSASEVRAHISAGTAITLSSGEISVTAGSIDTTQLTDDAVSRAKLKDEVGLVIYNSSGTALKTLYGAGS